MQIDIRMRYDTEMHKLTVDLDEACKWLDVSVDPELPMKEVEILIQQAVDEQYNKPEMANWHKQHRHISQNPKQKMLNGKRGYLCTDDDSSEDNFLEGCPDNRSNEEIEKRLSRYETEKLIHRVFPEADLAEMMIQIALDGVPIREYAKKFCENPYDAAQLAKAENSISHRYCRAKKKIEKYLK